MIHLLGDLVIKSRASSVVVETPPTVDSFYPSGSGPVTYGGGPFTSASTTESIRYTKRNRNRPWLANLCVHQKITKQVTMQGPMTFLTHTVASPTKQQVTSGFHFGSLDALNYSVTAAKAASPGFGVGAGYLNANGQILIDQHFDSMRPDLTEVSVPNFLFELTQLKSLISFWDIRRRRLVKPTKGSPASINLWYQYGVRPTVGDVASIISAVSNFREKIKAWNSRLGKFTSKRKTILREVVNSRGTFNHPVNGSSYPISWRSAAEQKATAHILFVPKPIQALSDLEFSIRGYLDSLGFELNPAAIWDAMPFSFVVDWVVDVGSMLERFKLDTLELPIELVDSYLQFKESFSVDIEYKFLGSSNYPKFTYPGAAYNETTFHRQQFHPGSQNFLNLGWKLPSLNQAGLGASIVITVLASK